MDTQIVGIAALYIVVELMKSIWPKKLEVIPTEVEAMIKELHALHSVRDNDGIPVWYMPRKMSAQQDKTLEVLQEISHTTKKTSEILDKIIDKLDNLGRND